MTDLLAILGVVWLLEQLDAYLAIFQCNHEGDGR